MSVTSKQELLRAKFIEKYMFAPEEIINDAKRELLIATEDSSYPYIHITINPVTEARATDILEYIVAKNSMRKIRIERKEQLERK